MLNNRRPSGLAATMILVAAHAGVARAEQGGHVLSAHRLAAFVATSDATRARTFYRDTLGLRLIREEPIALVFDANGTRLRVQIVPAVKPAPYTVLGWEVTDIEATVKELRQAGVMTEHFQGFKQDALGIWTADDGTRVAWFKDPDGNMLSVGQFPASKAVKPQP